MKKTAPPGAGGPPEQTPEEGDADRGKSDGPESVTLTVRQAARWLGISTPLVYRWCEKKRLPHHRSGADGRGHILISKTDLTTFGGRMKGEPQTDEDAPPEGTP